LSGAGIHHTVDMEKENSYPLRREDGTHFTKKMD